MKYKLSVIRGDGLLVGTIINELVIDENTKRQIEYNCRQQDDMTKSVDSSGTITWECPDLWLELIPIK